MKQYQLLPKIGWREFSQNKELSDHLYSVFMPLVNEGDWSYTNFTSDTGAFEDELGNSVLFEFQNDFEEDIDIIQSLNVSIVPVSLSKTSFLELTLLKVAKRYELYKAKSSDVN